MDEAKGIPLARAAMELRCGYWQCRDRILRGELAGWQDAQGRWQVDETALRQAVREQERTGAVNRRIAGRVPA